MRIVGGKHRSRNLSTLQGDNTRPSSDRLKEALFNKIGPYFDGGSFLDMFGGSGAVGLEALSRGVSSVVFVESNRYAIKVIEDNIKRLNEGDMCTIIKKDALMFSKETSEVYDYIFMDVMNNMVKTMKKGSLLIVETRKNHQLEVPDRLELLSSKAYGMALLSIFEMLD